MPAGPSNVASYDAIAPPQRFAAAPQAAPEPPKIFYKTHLRADEINYLPEDALKEGLGMVEALKANLKKLELGSKLRKDVWMREIDRWVYARYLVRNARC